VSTERREVNRQAKDTADPPPGGVPFTGPGGGNGAGGRTLDVSGGGSGRRGGRGWTPRRAAEGGGCALLDIRKDPLPVDCKDSTHDPGAEGPPPPPLSCLRPHCDAFHRPAVRGVAGGAPHLRGAARGPGDGPRAHGGQAACQKAPAPTDPLRGGGGEFGEGGAGGWNRQRGGTDGGPGRGVRGGLAGTSRRGCSSGPRAGRRRRRQEAADPPRPSTLRRGHGCFRTRKKVLKPPGCGGKTHPSPLEINPLQPLTKRTPT